MENVIPNNHIPVRYPKGTHQRLQPSLLALQMPVYYSTSFWLLKHAPFISYN
jgi:hypothetical protein